MRKKLGLLAALIPLLATLSAVPAQASLPSSYFQPVPNVVMDKPLDCESAALASALAYQGIGVGQDWVFSHLPDDGRRAITSGGMPARWGNPYEAFVGNVWGSIPYLTGYGVYAPPLINVAQQAGAEAFGGESYSLGQLEQYLVQGYSVVVLVPYNMESSYVAPMATWDNQEVWFSKQDHAQVLAGFDSNAGTFTVMDDFDGHYKTFPASTFTQRFTAFHSTAVMVRTPERAPTAAPPGSILSRYYSTTGGGHWVTTGAVTDAFVDLRDGRQEASFGTLAAQPGSGLLPIYSCVAGQAHFLSHDISCEGQAGIELDGYTATTPQPPYTAQIFRCRVPSAANDHFVSLDPGCEGQQSEGSLGFIAPVVTFTRWYDGVGHWTSDGAVPSRYAVDRTLGSMPAVPAPGMVALYACRIGAEDEFSSESASCEGQQMYGQVGWIYTQAPAGVTSVVLYRCYNGATHFDTTDPACEHGGNLDGGLGYIVAPPA